MVAYTLPAKTNRTAIHDGRRFILLAAPRSDRAANRNPHAGPGARVQLRSAKTAAAGIHYFPEVRCAFSGVVTFAVEGVVRVLERGFIMGGGEEMRPLRDRGEAVSNLLAQAEQGSNGDRGKAAQAIAEAAGFRDYAALWASIAQDDGEVVARQLIAWVL